MSIGKQFISNLSARGREVRSKARALLMAHILMGAVALIISALYIINGEVFKLVFVGVTLLSFAVSFTFGFRGRFQISAALISVSTFAFMGAMAYFNSDTHPASVFVTALYLATPTMLSALLSSKTRLIYILAIATVLAVLYTFFARVLPANPDISTADLVFRYLIFSLLLLFFIAHWTMEKHRIANRLLTEGDELQTRAQEKTVELEQNIADVRSGIGITADLVRNIEQIQSQVAAANREIQSIKDYIREFDSGFTESSGQVVSIGERIIDLNEAVFQQSSAQEESAASTNQMVASIQSVAGIVQAKSASARELMETTERGGQELESTVTLINEISGSVDSILEMVGIINKITSQTNLLSMNAAIEAAHAGDSGRGFAVVADEIRKLAENTAVNARNIGSVLKDVVQKISQSSKAGERTLAAFSRVSREVRETQAALEEIAASTDQLGAGSREILESISALTDLSSRVHGGAQTISSAQELIGKHMKGTGTMIVQLSGNLESIATGNDAIEESIGQLNQVAQSLLRINENIAKSSSAG